MKYLKKFSSLGIIGILMILMTFSNLVLAQNQESVFTVSDIKGIAGEQVEVLVGINDITKDLTSIDVEIYFDNQNLELISIEDTKMFSEFNGSQVETEYAILSWGSGLSRIPAETSGTIAKIKFEVLEEFTEGTTEIRARLRGAYDFDLNEIEIGEGSGTVTVERPAHDHTWSGWKEVKSATCTEDGSKERQCIISGCTETETQIIPMTGHSYDGKQEELLKADCTNDGSIRTYCSNEGCTSYTDTVVDKLGHKLGDWETIKEATCTETGLNEKHCTVCGVTLENENVEPLGHTLGEWEIVKEAGLNTTGLKTRVCAICEYIDEEIIPAIIHGEADHVYDGKEEIVKEATCTEAGTLRTYCSFEGCGAYQDKAIEARGHVEGDWTKVEEATCTEVGLEEKHCKVCDEKLDEKVIEALGHTFDGKEETEKEATCTEVGTLRTYCSFEGCEAYQDKAIGAGGHVEGDWTKVEEATCTEAGLEEKYCKVCDEKLDEKVIEALGHSFGEWEIIKEAQIGVEGLKERICSVCDKTDQEVLSALEENENSKDDEEEKKDEIVSEKEEVSASPVTGDTSIAMQMVILMIACMGVITVMARRKRA